VSRRRAAGWGAAALALTAGALFALAPGAEGPGERGPRAAAPRGDDDAPRTRLARGHVPASGPAVAQIRVPAIGVRAQVIELGLNRDRSLQVPSRASQAGWWSGGSFPGRRGPAVIAGHVESRAGAGVFARLGELRAGDRVLVGRPGRRATAFVVERSERAPKRRFPTVRVYGRTRGSTLRLITCGGSFDRARGHYRDNLIVFARRA
jgi:sortase (surface protein transpeptidase)